MNKESIKKSDSINAKTRHQNPRPENQTRWVWILLHFEPENDASFQPPAHDTWKHAALIREREFNLDGKNNSLIVFREKLLEVNSIYSYVVSSFRNDQSDSGLHIPTPKLISVELSYSGVHHSFLRLVGLI